MTSYIRILSIAAAAAILLPGTAEASYESEELRKQIKQDRLEIKSTERSNYDHDPDFANVLVATDGEPYIVDIGIYGVLEPIAFPDETWIMLGCFSETRRTYEGPGGDLMWLDLRVRHPDGVWDSREEGELGLVRGVCDLNGGIDTTFVEIPRGMEIRGWHLFIDSDERRAKNVREGRKTYSPLHVYERAEE